ncbi:MAG TPA: BMP family ABC transporter substrate-binding protein [Bacteroidales bacterium]|jgi:basic membrane protein A|nr:BMP family ABC transporter substrate-binding protein [Bacteroidales bacterium]|tara:strand:+ start:43 stop:1017 length:975 start_codon:yes stop_codon:yes gene_type:complete
MKNFFYILILLPLLFAFEASSADYALIYDEGGKFDKSFNEAAYDGAEKFKAETGEDYIEFEAATNAQIEQGLRKLAQRDAKVIVAMGFAMADGVAAVAAEHPDINFTIVDVDWLDGANIQQIAFREHEGSYLVGIIAAMKSESGVIGFVGGMDIPLIRKFHGGYEQGAKSVNPNITVLMNMTGTTGAAWNDPERGAELTKGQIAKGADVVYHAAGTTGEGVLQAAADSGILGIGVDKNQNHLHPGKVLTSMLKRVDVAVYDAFMSTKNGTYEAGKFSYGLAEGGVGWALDENNESLITADMKAAADKAASDIISGNIEVIDVSK